MLQGGALPIVLGAKRTFEYFFLKNFSLSNIYLYLCSKLK